MKRLLLSTAILLTSLSVYARVDVDVLVYYSYSENTYGGRYERRESKPVKARVSFISGAEFNILKPSTERYALVWFSQTECAVIKLEPKRFSSSYKLTWEDLPNLTGGFSSVSGEKVNGEELDDLDMPVRWHFDFRDKNRGNAYVDDRLERRFYSYDPLFI